MLYFHNFVCKTFIREGVYYHRGIPILMANSVSMGTRVPIFTLFAVRMGTRGPHFYMTPETKF